MLLVKYLITAILLFIAVLVLGGWYMHHRYGMSGQGYWG
jgi:hypothetical protein